MGIHKGILIWILLTACSFGGRAQDSPEDGETIDTLFTAVDLFDEEDPMEITLTFDLKQFQRTKEEEELIPVRFSYRINDTLEIQRAMRIRARGEFRRAFCSYAPFWLYLQGGETNDTTDGEMSRVKIVTHCMGSGNYTDYLLKEYLVYKLYNLLSPVSFRVRLIRMKYVDTGRKNRATESWAFMIEPEEVLAQRFDAMVIKNDELVMALMRQDVLDLVALFEFMIGNPDWSIKGRHNVKILGMPGFGTAGYTPVPYDFDYTGAVSATYAIPKEEMGINSVTDRLYLGLCLEASRLDATLLFLEDHHDEMISLVNGFPFLEDRPKRILANYLESFFELASNRSRIMNMLNSSCR